MKSRWLTNILLFTTIVILILIARYEPGIEEADVETVIPLNTSDIERVSVTRPLRDELLLEKDKDGFWWIMREPRLPAETFQVNALTRLAEQTVTRSYPVSDMNLGQLELDPPRASLTLNQTRIDFGGIDALENQRYLRVGDQVKLVPDLYLYRVEAGYTQFVRRKILPQHTHITSLTLPGLTLEKGDSGWLLSPTRDISGDDVQQFIDSWQAATAINVREADSQPQGERLTIRLAEQQQPVELVITSRKPELVLARPAFGIEYRMGDIAARLLEPALAGGPP
ncbi:hypothetical protein DFR30_0326 [Thiogranum longum]|uniref:DUF4340 domain-containing protein n=1 Tax=Thiogranum longum TaxID=1537524 RepID=A0A4V2PGK0_9GAMM|nr:DUF4340 domain-containing protein [Thiogranum longum]TCK17106.1 hypothetical protein DFR30_0326 [Thiogranum longum]